MMLASRIFLPAPMGLPVWMRRMKPGMSIDVGQDVTQGASKQ